VEFIVTACVTSASSILFIYWCGQAIRLIFG
jgi:hypothetical protein